MDETVLQEMFDELFSALESLETQNGAILQLLKNQGIAKDKDLAPLFEEAAKGSNVRWRATRLRVNHLLAKAPTANDTSQAPPASEPKKDPQAAQQQPREDADSKGRQSPADKPDEKSKAEKNHAPQQPSDAKPKAEEPAADKNAA